MDSYGRLNGGIYEHEGGGAVDDPEAPDVMDDHFRQVGEGAGEAIMEEDVGEAGGDMEAAP